MTRRKSRIVRIGNVHIGFDNKIATQSMLNFPAGDVEGNVKQARALEESGCDIIRVSVPSIQDVRLIDALKNAVAAPIVADIHFDYKIALECVSAGVDKIRINPGNIGGDDCVKAVAQACTGKGIPIRIGVNSGSLEKHILLKYGAPTPAALCESAMYHVNLLRRFDFDNIVISIKAPDVFKVIESYKMLSLLCDYPLHLGVTEAGPSHIGIVKSAIAIGTLLIDGIGDTIRVSLTDDPLKEVQAGFDILQSVGLKYDCPNVISCPTCGRTGIDMIAITNEVERRLRHIKKPISVAVMGCAVNGPGEARECDIGIAGGNGEGILFKKGEIIRKLSENEIIDVLIEEIEKM